MNKVLVIDNYDSFTYNLVHLIKEMNYDVTVVRNDKFDLDDISKFDKILLSPAIIKFYQILRYHLNQIYHF